MGAKAGIGVEAVIGIILIMLLGFFLGFIARRRRRHASFPSHTVEPKLEISEHTAELDEKDKSIAELECRGATR